MQRALWIAAGVALIASSARADVSSWCLWTQLYDLHAVQTRCGGKPSPAAETGFERLREAAVTAASGTIDELVSSLVNDLLEADNSDDTAIVAVRWRD